MLHNDNNDWCLCINYNSTNYTSIQTKRFGKEKFCQGFVANPPLIYLLKQNLLLCKRESYNLKNGLPVTLINLVW